MLIMSKVLYEFPNNDMVSCLLKNRPSCKNKSPYVADIVLPDEHLEEVLGDNLRYELSSSVF